MIDRRGVVKGALVLAALPFRANADPARLSFSGSLEQGSLVIGKAVAGARVAVDSADVSVSKEGLFAFGFEYDRTKPASVLARYSDGTEETQSVAPVLRHYEIQSITGLPETYVTPPPDIAGRIKREHERVAQARTRDTDGIAFATAFDWPAVGIISGLFGSQRILNGEPKSPHFGVDIAAPEGTPIHAPADGVVLITDDFFLEGGFTLLDHGHGVSTCYFHQSSRKVAEGDRVQRGALIGLVGKTGRATGPHLHWGMNWFQVRLDPSRSTATPQPPKT